MLRVESLERRKCWMLAVIVYEGCDDFGGGQMLICFYSKPVKHGRPGIGATHSSRFIPLK